MTIYTDQLGRKVEIIDFPKRIVSLVPSQTELLFDLGQKENIVGITNYCIHPKKMIRQGIREKKIKRIGGTKDFKIEKIESLEPDLIIANKEENDREKILELEKKTPVWISNVHNLPSAYQMIEVIGQMTNSLSEAQKIVATLRKEFTDLREANAISVAPKVLYFIWKEPHMLAGQDTFINHILQRANFENIVYMLPEANRYPQINEKQLKELNPEVIFLSSEPYPFKKTHIEEVRAICPQAEIQIVDGELFSWYGSRLLKSPSYLKKLYDSIELKFRKEDLF